MGGRGREGEEEGGERWEGEREERGRDGGGREESKEEGCVNTTKYILWSKHTRQVPALVKVQNIHQENGCICLQTEQYLHKSNGREAAHNLESAQPQWLRLAKVKAKVW